MAQSKDSVSGQNLTTLGKIINCSVIDDIATYTN